SADAAGPPPPEGEALRLANAFVCTANIEAADGGAAIVDGNRKVLAARLSDARFFWEQDRKTSLAEHARKLERITFHEKLGTVADKADRVAKLARWLVEEGIVGSNPSLATNPAQPELVKGHARSGEVSARASTGSARADLANLAEQAARLAKADLVTEMVGEFPELQGLMGGYYARAEGLPDAVADAIRDHYKPVGQGDEVPTAPVTVAVSLADKLDTLASFFDIEEFPTGSKDPFALRRAALGILRLVRTNGLVLHLGSVLDIAWLAHQDTELSDREIARRKVISTVPSFILDRMEVAMRDAGIRHDFIRASRAWNAAEDGRLDRVESRATSLQSFMQTEDGANLLAGYKRAANILKKEGWGDKSSPLQGRGGSAAGAEGVGAVGSLPAPASPHPNPSPKGEGLTDGIPRTGEEDPLALVDDPDLAPVIKAKMAERKQNALSYTAEPAEEALIAALEAAEPRAQKAVAAEDFGAAMAALASLRAAVDRFFEEVTVNDTDPAKRAARLDLLLRFRDAVHQVADFSRIEG
ncbi:MAG: glycine--tRNA ligase subunit beta, partial [Tsuneonella sp.]